jgi:peptidoglycan/xylan/chitin deacetylase (PgdA/CDA1 family)
MPNKEKAKQRLRGIAASAMHYSGASRVLQMGEEYHWRILMYHRVVRPQDSRYPLQPGMYVTPETFELQMNYLHDHAHVVPLDELAGNIAQGNSIAPRTVAITFDDGWADVYSNACPILTRYKLPATVFLVTSFVGTNESLWSDKVALALTALQNEKQYLQTACLRIKQNSEIDPGICSQILAVLEFTGGEPIAGVLDTLIESLKNLSLQQRKTTVSSISALAREFTSMKLLRSFLNWEEVREMAKSGISFGSHGHKHYPLPELSEAQINDEIDNSYQVFRERDLAPSLVFCYPGGDYDENTQGILAQKEIRFALTTDKMPNLGTLPMLLSRIAIHDDISNTVPLFTSRVWVEGVF